jgi:hypothetical protein
MTFEYPENPITNRKDPFRDEGGKNPFADEQLPDVDSPASPYAASAEATGVSYRPEDYETILPHRGRLVFWLGATGLASSVLGGMGVVLLLVASPNTAGIGISLCAIMLPLGLALSWSAWITGRHDLRAIGAGAMDDSGRSRTQRGHVMGIIGALIGIAPIGYFVLLIVRMIAEEI